jgi:predicted dehydrogenase
MSSYNVQILVPSSSRQLNIPVTMKRSTKLILSLSIESQPRFIKAALLAGKHVLSEKPVAENIQDAEDLIKWYRADIKGPTWAVAENFRYLNSYNYAAEQLKTMGKITGFQGRQQGTIPIDMKFNRQSPISLLFHKLITNLVTPWRRVPTHQGGYLLDGGVHYMAGLRLLLGAQPGNEITTLSAFTNQLQPYLPPVDTADMILRTRSGKTGVFQVSRGTTLRADEWTVACEDGWIKIEDEKVTISRNGQEETVSVANERTGVPPEVRVWGASLVAGKIVPEQEPEAALADLELVS